jgi:hypothetical protein
MMGGLEERIIVELSAYVLERLHEDDEFILSRGHVTIPEVSPSVT